MTPEGGRRCAGRPPVLQSRSVGGPAERLRALGLGLDHGSVQLVETPDAWARAGEELAAEVAALLGDRAVAVEAVGSSAVVGLLAKLIVDLAVGLGPDQPLEPVHTALTRAGWEHRGDAGEHGGQVFVLDARPWHRVAHLHVVDHGGRQWTNYLAFRDLLRHDDDARRRYGEDKVRAAEEHQDDRPSYQAAKGGFVDGVLGSLGLDAWP